MEKTSKSARISHDQRVVMLSFMEEHKDLARGKLSGPDAVRKKTELWNSLAISLNSMGVGSTKSTDKWMKSWQDWRSDIKAKVRKLNSEAQKAEGKSQYEITHLTPLEERLMALIGIESADTSGVFDTSELSESATDQEMPQEMWADSEGASTSAQPKRDPLTPSPTLVPIISPTSDPGPSSPPTRRKKQRNPSGIDDDDASTRIAASWERIAKAAERLASVGEGFLDLGEGFLNLGKGFLDKYKSD